MGKTEWILCPVCGSKTCDRFREDTVYNRHQRAGRKDAEPMNLCANTVNGSFFIFDQAHQIKKGGLGGLFCHAQMKTCPSKPVLGFGGIFMCWSEMTTLLLVRSSNYITFMRT